MNYLASACHFGVQPTKLSQLNKLFMIFFASQVQSHLAVLVTRLFVYIPTQPP